MSAKYMGLALACCALFLTTAAGIARAESPLADAAQNGDLKAVRALLRDGVDVNATQADGMTALHWAVHRDDLELADLLLEAGADFRLANRTGARPIYLAAVNANAAMIELLLDAGEDPNAVVTGEAETVLMIAAHTGNPDAVRLLLERGADANAKQIRGFTPAMFAAAEGHAEAIEVLAEHGADLAAATVPSTKQERRPAGGMTALLFACRQGHMDAALALLEAGADVNQASADNTSPLLIAIVNGHYDLGSELLKRGADPNIADNDGRAPLFAAIDLRNVQWSQAPAPELPQERHMAMIRQLVEAGANLEQKIEGKVGHRGSFDMRWTDFVDGTPFLRAAWNGDIEVMRYLLEKGADPSVATEKGENAILLLAGAGWPLGQGFLRSEEEIRASLDLLVEELGQDVNSATTEGITPLIGAVFKGDNYVVQYLVDHGARLDVKDAEGRDIIVWAKGIAANEGQPPRPQPQTEALLRELMEQKGITIASAN